MRISKFHRKQQTFVKVRSATSSLLIKFFEHNNKGRELGPDSSFCNHDCERGIDSEPTRLAKRARFWKLHVHGQEKNYLLGAQSECLANKSSF